jgi:hypothetical protein
MTEETLFAEALGKTGAERAAFLDKHCQNNVELRKRLEALLRAGDNPDPQSGYTGTFLESLKSYLLSAVALALRVGRTAIGNDFRRALENGSCGEQLTELRAEDWPGQTGRAALGFQAYLVAGKGRNLAARTLNQLDRLGKPMHHETAARGQCKSVHIHTTTGGKLRRRRRKTMHVSILQ